MGPAARPAAAALRVMADADSDPSVRSTAAAALKKITAPDKKAGAPKG
jgi:hypothetical protein